MAEDKALKRLMKRQSRLTQPGSNDHLFQRRVSRRLVPRVCIVCGKDFEAVQIGEREPSTRCSEACRREARRRYSNAYNAAGKAKLAELLALAATGELERFGIGRDGQPMPNAGNDFDRK